MLMFAKNIFANNTKANVKQYDKHDAQIPIYCKNTKLKDTLKIAPAIVITALIFVFPFATTMVEYILLIADAIAPIDIIGT